MLNIRMTFLLKLFGSRFSAIMVAVMFGIIVAGGVAYKIDALRRDKREMSLQQSNEKLTEQNRQQAERIDILVEESARYSARVSQITAEFDALNRKINQNTVRRDQTTKEIAPPVSPNISTQELEQRANNMNVVFDELSTIGRQK